MIEMANAKWQKFSQQELLFIFQTSSSIKDAMQKIGYLVMILL
jgi:hypothetical protein